MNLKVIIVKALDVIAGSLILAAFVAVIVGCLIAPAFQ